MIYYVIYSTLAMLALYEVAITNNGENFKIKRIRLGNSEFEYKTNITFILIIIFLITFASIRWKTGIDFNNYENLYNKIHAGTSVQVELTFQILARAAGSFTQLLAIYAIISIVPDYLIIQRYADYLYVSLLLFFSTIFLRYDMGIIRQGAALSLTMYSIRYAKKRQWVPFVGFVVLAILFHNSAMAFLVIWFVINKKIPRSVMLITVGVCVLVGFTGVWAGIFGLLSRIPLPMMSRYITYFLNNSFYQPTLSITDLQTLVLFSAFLYFKKDYDENEEDKIYSFLVNVYFIGTCLFWIFRQFYSFSGRGISYFYQVEILLIPALLKRIKRRGLRLLATALVCAYAFYYVYVVVHFDASTSWMNSSYIPYKTIFSK